MTMTIPADRNHPTLRPFASILTPSSPRLLTQSFAETDLPDRDIGVAWRRAVNQAVGRVIRHQHDYGAIILCDDRFLSEGVRSNISLWLRDRVDQFPTFGAATVSLTGFFKVCPQFHGTGVLRQHGDRVWSVCTDR